MGERGLLGSEVLLPSGAPGDVQALLEEIQDTLGIPWLPYPWARFAKHPNILRLFWGHLKDCVSNEVFLRESLAISGRVHMSVHSWFRPSMGEPLREIERPLEKASRRGNPCQNPERGQSLRCELDAFEFGFPQVLIQLLILQGLLQGQGVGIEGMAVKRTQQSGLRRPEIEWPVRDDIDSETRQSLEVFGGYWSQPAGVPEIIALAKWPRFVARAAEELRFWKPRPEYIALRSRVRHVAEESLDRVRPRMQIPEEEIRAAFGPSEAWPERLENPRETVYAFAESMPGMIVDNALLRVAADAWSMAYPETKGST